MWFIHSCAQICYKKRQLSSAYIIGWSVVGRIDIKTAVIMLLICPVLYFLLRKMAKFLKANLGRALDAILWAIGRIFQRSMARRVDLRRYCRIQLAKASYRYLNVPGRQSVPLETDQIFVPLAFEAVTGELRTAENLLDLGNRLRIVGDPGSGKTSLTKKMFREACSSGISAYGAKPRLPIAIELKSFVPPRNLTSETALSKWAIGKLKGLVTEVHGFSMEELFDSYVSEYGLDVFLDGLDEVASDSYSRTATAINGLSRLLANLSVANRIFLTMRVQFHQQVHAHFDDEFPPVVQIRPFTPGDIYAFLTRWPFPREAGANITRIFGDLTDRPTVREMCTNPLVLAMYVANDQSSDTVSGSADTRTAFYNHVVEELLVTRRSRQLGITARTALLEQRESILGHLAVENLSNPNVATNVIDWDRALDITMSTYNTTRDAAVTRLQELQTDTGIISEERPRETLRFIHLTFCEYLAAKEYAQGKKAGWKEVIQLHSAFADSPHPQVRTRLIEVIPFTLGLLVRSERAEALNDVVDLKDQLILGRCLLETQLYDHDAWQVYWETESNYLVDIKAGDVDQISSEWLNRLHLFNVVLSDQAQWAAIYGRTVPVSLGDVFGKIVKADRERLTQVFTSYASRDPAAAFRLAEATGFNLITGQRWLVVENLANPPFLDIAIERAQRQSADIVDWALALSEGSIISFLVAIKLNGIAPGPAVTDRLKKVDSKLRWYPFPLPIFEDSSGNLRFSRGRWWKTFAPDYPVAQPPSPSLLSAAITLSAEQVVANKENQDFEKLTFLSSIKPSGTLLPSWLFKALAIAVAIVGTLGPPVIINKQINNILVLAGGIVASTLFLGISFMLYTYPIARQRLYLRLFGMSDPMPPNRLAEIGSGLLVKLVFTKARKFLPPN